MTERLLMRQVLELLHLKYEKRLATGPLPEPVGWAWPRCQPHCPPILGSVKPRCATVLGLIKIDPRFWVSIARRHETPKPPVAMVGARRVFRPVCAHGAPGRSVRSSTWSPSPERLQRQSRSPGSVAGPRTPPGRSDDSARLCRSVAGAGGECTGAGSRRLRPRARRRRRTLGRGHTAAA